jgi:hypothetical protein
MNPMPAELSIQAVLGDVVGSTGHRYGVRDSDGNTMDTAKIIANPSGGYLAIYHRGDEVKLASSTDLLTWELIRTLDPQATQPTIHLLPTGGFLTAVEYNDQVGSGGRLRLRHYPGLDALLAGTFDRERTLARTLSLCNEGTPTVLAAGLSPDIDHSVIEIGFHYHRNCDIDRQARGTLIDFSFWSTETDPAADHALTTAATIQGHTVKGNIGDRDSLVFGDTRYSVHEIQYTKKDFGSWRMYLRNLETGIAEFLPVVTHGGSTAFANPTVTALTSPAGRPAIVATLFIPSEGAADGEGGELIYYREFIDRDPTADVPAVQNAHSVR